MHPPASQALWHQGESFSIGHNFLLSLCSLHGSLFCWSKVKKSFFTCKLHTLSLSAVATADLLHTCAEKWPACCLCGKPMWQQKPQASKLNKTLQTASPCSLFVLIQTQISWANSFPCQAFKMTGWFRLLKEIRSSLLYRSKQTPFQLKPLTLMQKCFFTWLQIPDVKLRAYASRRTSTISSRSCNVI